MAVMAVKANDQENTYLVDDEIYRKMTFVIDNREFFRRRLHKAGIEPELLGECLTNLEDFRATYTIYGHGYGVTKEELVDINNNPIEMENLRPIDRDAIAKCKLTYFNVGTHTILEYPITGVIEIKEELLDGLEEN